MDALNRLVEADAIRRLADRDASLYTENIDARIPIMQRLGWNDLAQKAPGRFVLLENLTKAIIEEGATDLVLLGMGGSSLAPLVLSRVIGGSPGKPRLHVLDTTSPVAVTRLLATLDPAGTFVLVSSKSGTTVEPLSLYAILRAWLEETLPRPVAGRHCFVITDPGTPLEKLRQRDLMRVTLNAPPTVGGRFSALTMFGLAPAALTGIDLELLVARAAAMEEACRLPAAENPGALLAAWMTDAYDGGHDKLTIVTSPALAPFGLWVEQLVAESLGKDGRGIVPVIEHDPTLPSGYGDDRAVAVLRLENDELLTSWSRDVAPTHPVFEMTVRDTYDLGAEFVRWEHAVALVGFLQGVNPFNEPNVAEAKSATSAILSGSTTVPPATADFDGSWVTFAGGLEAPASPPVSRVNALRALLGTATEGDYIAILAYLPDDESVLGPLNRCAKTVSDATGRAVCVELGPRYLHSTGQLHKGGPNSGVFLLVTARDRADIEIPGEKFRLAALHRAQAEGDLVTLAAHGRRILRIDLPSSNHGAVAALAEDIASAVR
ncbi:MAG: glucose-6-phosphate isomerase [Actinobacteria bacterium HGW-Actinobacteria-1]|jgi:glucose-6-phosphate isomerase|nr:MAG: glucose-6-phosphate isomerase [Actinobacteria bacterium HGW-Actinobacteria-1]